MLRIALGYFLVSCRCRRGLGVCIDSNIAFLFIWGLNYNSWKWVFFESGIEVALWVFLCFYYGKLYVFYEGKRVRFRGKSLMR